MIVKQQTEFDALKILGAARTKETDAMVDQFNVERKRKEFHYTDVNNVDADIDADVDDAIDDFGRSTNSSVEKSTVSFV